MNEKIEVGIVVLNFNTARDVYTCLESILKHTHLSYKICIVDNSTDNSRTVDKSKLSNGIDFIRLESNRGYAHDNNIGIDYIISSYNPEYILVMNPDVTIIHDYTIDNLINKIKNTKGYICGIQPLVWTPRFGDDPSMQINIRSCMSYFECCISSFHPLQSIFKKRFAKTIYKDKMPYKNDIKFEVPSGCFFITKTKILQKVGLFDDRTFLYNEEVILGYKLKQEGYSYLLDTDVVVQHEQGVSTGALKKTVSKKLIGYHRDSLDIYVKDYLKVSMLKVYFLHFLIYLNYLGKLAKYNLLQLR